MSRRPGGPATGPPAARPRTGTAQETNPTRTADWRKCGTIAPPSPQSLQIPKTQDPVTHRRAITDMNIRHERPDPALAFLVQAPLLLHTSAEQSFELRGWSPDGFEPPEGWTDCPPVATLTVPFQGVYVSFDVELAQDAPGGFVRFAGLSARAAGMLDLFHAAILRGEITPVDGILMALDRPVDLVPMTRTDAETGRSPARPLSRALRAVGVTAAYAAAAAFLWAAFWSNAWDRLNAIPLQAGRIELVQPVRATAAAAGPEAPAGGLVASGWIDGAHATDIYLGMAAQLAVNVGGTLVELPARVTDIHARDAAQGPRRPGYAIQIEADAAEIAARPELAAVLYPGSAAAIAVSTPLLPGAIHTALGLCARVTGTECGRGTWPRRLPAALPTGLADVRAAPPLLPEGAPGGVAFLAAFGAAAAQPDRLPDAD